MRFILKMLALSGLLYAFCGNLSAQTLSLDKNNFQQPLSTYILYMQDPEGKLAYEDVVTMDDSKWEHNSKAIFNHGYNSSTWWIKLKINNVDDVALKRLLEISYPVLDYISVYVISSSGTETFLLGDKLPFNQRPIDHRNFVVPIAWQANEALTIYLSVKSSSSTQVPLTLWEEHTFFNYDRTQTLIHGIYYGIMFVMVMYNLFVYLAVGERNYLYYVLFVSSMPLFLSSLNGFAFQYLWPSFTTWNDQSILVMLSASVIWGSLFTHNFLDSAELKGLFGRIMPILAVSGVGVIILSFILPYSIVIRILIPYASVACIYGVSQGVYRWYTGGLSAKYYTIAWSSLLVGGLVLALNKFNILPKNLFTEYATQIGSALEVILLSFALAERINQERKMRFEAQQDALLTERELRHAREHALDVQKQATESLELRVQERTKELESLNQRLEELSDTDQLTGLKNRRFLDRILSEEYARCARYGHNLGVLLMDIDHFKLFNDNYGHLIGDDCLKEVAQCIKKGLRWPSDRPARYGGEEFCVLLPETNIEGALTVAERIRENVESLEFYVKGERVQVAVSIGVCTQIPSTTVAPEHMIELADQALYSSKENGRNRVTLHCGDDPHSAQAENHSA